MERIFLDANVLFSAAYRAQSGLLGLWRLTDTVLCSSRYALEEARKNLDQEEQRKRLDSLSDSLHFFDTLERKLPSGATLAEKDVPILLAAIEAKADYLLTGDLRHFGQYIGKRIAGVRIILPGEYLRLRRERG